MKYPTKEQDDDYFGIDDSNASMPSVKSINNFDGKPTRLHTACIMKLIDFKDN